MKKHLIISYNLHFIKFLYLSQQPQNQKSLCLTAFNAQKRLTHSILFFVGRNKSHGCGLPGRGAAALPWRPWPGHELRTVFGRLRDATRNIATTFTFLGSSSGRVTLAHQLRERQRKDTEKSFLYLFDIRSFRFILNHTFREN